MPASDSASSNPNLKWYVCGLLLLALVLNYMDRQTLSLTITAIEQEIHLSNTQYGRLEKGFGYAFAFGGLAFGILADRVGVRWLYPFVLLGWSTAGLATGFADRIGQLVTPIFLSLQGPSRVAEITLTSDASLTQSYLGFLCCRVVLGLFEAGQWPCALVTTQRILSQADRSFGNSILQSGASIGAIITPLVVGLFDTGALGWWRSPYVVIGSLGVLWVGPWLWTTWGVDLSLARTRLSEPAREDNRNDQPLNTTTAPVESTAPFLLVRRYAALVVVVIVINLTWQYFRVWLPKMLEQYHGYSKPNVRWFTTAYYISTDVGCIAAGVTVKWLASRGIAVHRARMATFGFCALLTSLSVVAASLPKGPLLLMTFLVIGFGALGMFPNYYSFTQELSSRHQGKISGSLAFITWIVTSEMQQLVGAEIDRTGSYQSGIFWVGLLPLLGFAALLLLWGKTDSSAPSRTVSA